jgi:glycosyltransferase involved in cell wall biosynthesis
MKIAWIVEKCLDISIDHATWTETARLLIEQGHEVTIYSGYKSRKEPFALGKSIRYLPSIKKPVLGLISVTISMVFLLMKLSFFKRPELVIMHPMALPAFLPFILFKKCGFIRSKWVLDIRTLPVVSGGLMAAWQNKEFDWALILAKWAFDGIAVITPFMQDVLVEKYGLHDKSIDYWTSGAHEYWLVHNEETEAHGVQIRKSLKLENKLVFMYHGIMPPNRGLENMIHAASQLKEEKERIHFIFLGDGALRKELKVLVSNLQCTDMVTFVDSVPHAEVRHYLAAIDVGVIPLPARIEWRVSSPIKLMEYLATGKPVVLTDIEAHVNVVKNEPFGYFYPAEQPGHMVDAIKKVLSSQDQLKAQGALGTQLIKSHYTWQSQAKRLELFLHSLL